MFDHSRTFFDHFSNYKLCEIDPLVAQAMDLACEQKETPVEKIINRHLIEMMTYGQTILDFEKIMKELKDAIN